MRPHHTRRTSARQCSLGLSRQGRGPRWPSPPDHLMRGQADNVRASEGPPTQKVLPLGWVAEPEYGSGYPQDHTLAMALDHLSQPLNRSRQHLPLCFPSLLGSQDQCGITLKQVALSALPRHRGPLVLPESRGLPSRAACSQRFRGARTDVW